MKETILKIKGMVCTGCENRVKNALKTIDGIEEVEANYTNGIVKVSSKDDISESLMKEKIDDIGFEIID